MSSAWWWPPGRAGGALAQKLRHDGLEVVLVTPVAEVSTWTRKTMEQHRIQARLLELGVEIATSRRLVSIGDGEVELACSYTGRPSRLEMASFVLVTSRPPEEALYQELGAGSKALEEAGVTSVERIGDCLCPGSIASAVHSGHRSAGELDQPETKGVPFRRELPGLEPA